MRSIASRVSIIIPAYNCEDTIQETIDSALAQTYDDFEVIVVNDGSTDDTWKVVDQYSDAVTAIKKINNGGVAAARNAGFDISTGDFILPLDADDIISPDYLEKTFPLTRDFGVGIVSTDMVRFGDINDRIRPGVPTSKFNNLPTTSLISARALRVHDGPWNPDVVYEDWDLWLNIIEDGWRVVFLNDPLFFYRVRKNTRNALQDKDKAKHEEQIRRRHE